MSGRTIDFFDSYELTVKFNFDGKEHTGTLTINNSGIPKLDIHTDDHRLIFEEHRTIEQTITCHEIGTRRTFTLYSCELQRGGVIICEFVATGSAISDNSDQMEIFLTGVSTWFERMRSNVITETEFKRYTEVDKFSVNFSFKGGNYSIENKRSVTANQLAPTEQKVTVEDSFVLKKKAGGFTLNESKDIALEIRNLFSLLLGKALSIKYIYLVPSSERHNYQSYIFPSVAYEQIPLTNCHQALCQFNNVVKWDLWKSIITNFFQVASFRNVWNRLVPILSNSHSNIWEYEILSVVVTLEMYCEQESKGKGHKLNKQTHRGLILGLSTALKEFTDNNELSCEDQEVLEGIKGVISNLRNTSHPTLQHKYDFLMAKTSSEIKEAISFSESDFTVLKTLRNSVAHGLNYKTVIPGEITKEVQIKDRLLTLLIYFVFHELGFSDSQIALNLNCTHHSFIVNAGGNKRARDKLTGTAEFITLAEEVDLKEYKPYDFIVLDYRSSSEQYTLNQELSFETKNNWHDSGISDVRDFVKSKILPKKGYDLKYINQMYLTSGKHEKCYYGVLVLSVN